MHILHTVLYTFPEVLTKRIYVIINSNFIQMVIISFILMTVMFDSGVILLGENKCWSLLGVKGT